MKPSAAPAPESDFRSYCLRCLRARSVCYCAEIQPFSPSCEFILLQHPRERRNPIGTARMTHLCLSNSQLIPGIAFDEDPAVKAILDSPEIHSVVLFPSPDALNISDEKEELLRRARSRLAIFVIDGTWSQARGMLRKSPKLAALPRISFNPDRLSRYRVRKQPNPLCLSTIEAVHRIVEILDPSEEAKTLLRAFDRMVDHQVKCAEQGKLREGFRPRKVSG